MNIVTIRIEYLLGVLAHIEVESQMVDCLAELCKMRMYVSLRVDQFYGRTFVESEFILMEGAPGKEAIEARVKEWVEKCKENFQGLDEVHESRLIVHVEQARYTVDKPRTMFSWKPPSGGNTYQVAGGGTIRITDHESGRSLEGRADNICFSCQ